MLEYINFGLKIYGFCMIINKILNPAIFIYAFCKSNLLAFNMFD